MALMQRIKEGKLKVNKRNYDAVMHAFCESYEFNHSLKLADLEWLPDPEGVAEAAPLFEQWVIDAHIACGEDGQEIKERFVKLKAAIRRGELRK